MRLNSYRQQYREAMNNGATSNQPHHYASIGAIVNSSASTLFKNNIIHNLNPDHVTSGDHTYSKMYLTPFAMNITKIIHSWGMISSGHSNNGVIVLLLNILLIH